MPAGQNVPLVSPLALAALCLFLLPLHAAVAAEDLGASTKPAETPAEQAAKKAYAENLAQYKDNADVLVRPGLLANRKDRTVRIWAKATGISSGEPLEFVMIPPDSGKDYEALAVAFVKPSDVHAALEFIGMKPGRPVNYALDQYWPKGERVLINAEWDEHMEHPQEARAPRKFHVRVEDLILNANIRKPLPKTGFVFTGSFWIKPRNGGKPVYAADEQDSKSIAADYNDRSTVMDVPRQAPQSQVYGTQKLNPEYKLDAGQPMQFILEPEHKDGKLRVQDLSLTIGMPPGAVNPQAGKYALADASGKKIGRDDSLLSLLSSFGDITEAGQDPFVTLHVDDAVHLRELLGIYKVLKELDNEDGVRIDAPPEGHLYYRAFFPKDEWRDRSKRLGRPWELHLVVKDKQVAGTLILPADEIENNNGKGDLKWTVGSGDETAQILAEKSNRFSQSVYVFAPGNMTCGQLMSFIRPGMKTHTMYIFLPTEK